MSDDFIDSLVAGLRPVRRSTMRRRLVLGLALGVLVAALALVLWIRLRPDLPGAMTQSVFWLKFGYTLALAACGFLAVDRLARPGADGRLALLLPLGFLAVMAVLALMQLGFADPAQMRRLVMGSTALVCPFYILALAVPIFAVVVIVMRSLAPTNLTTAGLAAGLLSGGASAWVYAFHCTESGLPFLAIWYTLGVAICAALGAAAGRYLLRW